jgi:rubrerythrin
MFSASEILDIAIRIEENGEQFYRKAMVRTTDQSLSEMLFWFAQQEKLHRDFFVEMKRTLIAAGARHWEEQLSGAMLKSAMANHLFSLDEVDVDSIPDVKGIVDTALGLEEDTVMFYEIIASFVTDPDVLQKLKAIINEEQKHIELFRERLDELREMEKDMAEITEEQ